MNTWTVKMNAWTGDANATGLLDRSIYMHEIPLHICSIIFYFLDRNHLWEEAALKMGYSPFDVIRFRQSSQWERRSPTDLLISNWGNYNHTVTEFFMVLHSLKQYPVMECLKQFVDPNCHHLILKGEPFFKALMESDLDKYPSGIGEEDQNPEKIPNEPKLATKTTKSETGSNSIASISNGFGSGNINNCAIAVPRILYSELSSATNNWDEKTILGRGGFGIVFKGRWKYTDVAIKRIEYHAAASDPEKNARIQMEQSSNELRYLNACRHDNILPLYGFSVDGEAPCLVYQFMAGGSLEKRLRITANDTNKPLSWEQRKIIAVGTARGLQYLHTFDRQNPVIHGDIKPANILLDSSCIPKIGDFGLAREGSFKPMRVSRVHGTRPYLPKEFIEGGHQSTKIDTFSYGVVLFELMTGLPAYDKSRDSDNRFLVEYMWSMYKMGLDQIIQQFYRSIEERKDDFSGLDFYMLIFMLGLWCTGVDDRPEMVEVLNQFETLIGRTAGLRAQGLH